MNNKPNDEFSIIFSKGQETYHSKETPVLSYKDINDILKPDCFALFVRVSIADIIGNSNDAKRLGYNPTRLSNDIIRSINLELYRPHIMDDNSYDLYRNQSAILLSNLILEGLSYYDITDVDFIEIIEIFRD